MCTLRAVGADAGSRVRASPRLHVDPLWLPPFFVFPAASAPPPYYRHPIAMNTHTHTFLATRLMHSSQRWGVGVEESGSLLAERELSCMTDRVGTTWVGQVQSATSLTHFKLPQKKNHDLDLGMPRGSHSQRSCKENALVHPPCQPPCHPACIL